LLRQAKRRNSDTFACPFKVGGRASRIDAQTQVRGKVVPVQVALMASSPDHRRPLASAHRLLCRTSDLVRVRVRHSCRHGRRWFDYESPPGRLTLGDDIDGCGGRDPCSPRRPRSAGFGGDDRENRRHPSMPEIRSARYDVSAEFIFRPMYGVYAEWVRSGGRRGRVVRGPVWLLCRYPIARSPSFRTASAKADRSSRFGLLQPTIYQALAKRTG
jgi:hypothetical protein